LYGNVGLSTHPETAHRVSPEMFSWFPLYFPFKAPLYLPSGSELEVNIWRLSDQKGKKVWYEWCAEAYLPTSTSTNAIGSSAPGSGVGGVWTGGSGNEGVSPNGMRGPFGGVGGQPSPLMDAPFSPGLVMGQGGEAGRVKISQANLHNPGGISSWVGL
jgi:protein arginine N-methyltransferase 5